jgi:hypothetical protein
LHTAHSHTSSFIPLIPHRTFLAHPLSHALAYH